MAINRNVLTAADVSAGTTSQEDTARERLLKFVPIETIGAYTAIEAGFKTAEDGTTTVSDGLVWFVVIFLTAFTAAYLWRFQDVRRVSQLGVSMAAFFVYALTIGGVFATRVVRIDPIYQLIMLVLAGLVLLFFKPPTPVPAPPAG